MSLSCCRCAVVLACALAADATAQNRLWITQFGTTKDDALCGLAADGTGGTYFAGFTGGSLPGPNGGEWDYILGRLDAQGGVSWVKQFPMAATQAVRGLIRDGSSLFVLSTTGGDALLARHDLQGNVVWSRQFGTANLELPKAISPDGSGGVFIAGQLGQGFPAPTVPGVEDSWITRYDSAGNRLWFVSITGLERERVWALAPAGGTDFYVAGSLGLGSGAWLARYTAAGQQVWTRQFGASTLAVFALAADSSGGVFATGGPMGANPGDKFLARYDGAGTQLWLQPLASAPVGAVPDGAGGLYIAYYAAPSDVQLTRIDSAGNALWSRQWGSPSHDDIRTLAPGATGGVLIGGTTFGNMAAPFLGGVDAGDLWAAEYSGCFADCNLDGVLTLADFGCFQTKFALGDPYADCNGDGVRNLSDFGCFQTSFALGCP